MAKTIISVLAVLFVCLIGFMIIDPSVQLGATLGGGGGSPTTLKISVGITGSIMNQGTYVLESGDTLSTLIDTAGGLTSLADDKCFFLDYVDKVNINSAELEDLMSVSGIGSVSGQSIIDYREANGEFRCLENITKVNGIGKTTFEKIKNYICLA